MRTFPILLLGVTICTIAGSQSPPASATWGNIMNNKGVPVTELSRLPNQHWTFTSIDFPGALQTSSSAALWGINPEGDIVGAYNGSDGNVHGLLRTGDGAFTSLDVPGATFTYANGINACGDVVGGYTSDPSFQVLHSYLRRSGEFITIDFPGAAFSAAFGINGHGDVVGVYKSADNHRHGYLLSHGEFTAVDFPGATFTSAEGISHRGEIVGFYSIDGNSFHGFVRRALWRKSPEEDRRSNGSEFLSIGYPGATFTRASGVNVRGDIVGDYTGADGREHGYLLSRGKFLPVDFPDAIFTRAYGINAHGEIVGDYQSADGKFHGFLLGEDGEDHSAENTQ
jgi:uncharacterized membrane protein